MLLDSTFDSVITKLCMSTTRLYGLIKSTTQTMPMMYQKGFNVFVFVPHSTCLTFSHATACTVVSSRNSFPALSLPDLLSAEHQHN